MELTSPHPVWLDPFYPPEPIVRIFAFGFIAACISVIGYQIASRTFLKVNDVSKKASNLALIGLVITFFGSAGKFPFPEILFNLYGLVAACGRAAPFALVIVPCVMIFGGLWCRLVRWLSKES